MSQKLFKYKSDSKYGIEDLINNRLWMTSMYEMNDPVEFGFYVQNAVFPNIVDFQNLLLKSKICVSFSKSSELKRLWNYYTNSMKGFVIEYSDSCIREAFKALTISTVCLKTAPICTNGDRILRDFAIEGDVNYGIYKKIDLTDFYQSYVEQKPGSVYIDSLKFLNKDKSWEDEEEYRFVFDFLDRLKVVNDGREGIYLHNLKPNAIYIGYRMSSEHTKTIKQYCKENNIPLYQYSPDFLSPDATSFYKECLFSPDKPNDMFSIERVQMPR